MKHIFLILLSLQALCFTSAARASDLAEMLPELLTNSNKQKAAVIEKMSELDDDRVLPVLKAMLNARLYATEKDGTFVYIQEPKNDEYDISSVLTGEDLGMMHDRDLDKIRINNKLRRVLRANIAKLELTSKDEDLRFKSAKNLAKTPDDELRSEIVNAIKQEQVRRVKEAMQLALAMIDIDGNDEDKRTIALQVIGESIAPEAVNVLRRLSAKNDEGEFEDANTELAERAEKLMEQAQGQLKFYKVIQDFIFGLSLGSILLLAAIGLAITFGVMGVINMAHGEMIMLGAYTTFAIQQIFPELIQYSLFIAIPAAFLVSGCVGVLIERLVIRHLYGRQLDTLLATFGISLILQQAVRMYSSNNVAVVSPDFISGFWQMNDAVAITYNRIYVLFFSLIVLGLLALVLKKTLLGLQMRAVTQNRAMANSMGIHSSWVDALTFGLGSGIAGIAGVALSQFTNVGPNLGQGYIIDSFMVVVFGGVGNLLGTFFGAMSLGVANKFLEPYTGAVVGKILVLVFIILFIQWRPRGLFALKGRFVED